jgi:DNA-binding response OmpR family regulator
MGKKILIVDDDRTIRAILEKQLILRGFWVYSAQDGAEGKMMALKERPDLIICDFLIPKIHGLDLCKMVKSAPELQHTKIIMMTGVYKGSFGKKEAMDSGADDFFQKPVDMDKLLKRVYENLNLDEDEFTREFVKDPGNGESE